MNAPDDPTPDSALESGPPGGHLGPGDLAPDEERLLAALERDARTPAPPVDEVAALRAEQGGPPDDGLTPTFTAPGDA